MHIQLRKLTLHCSRLYCVSVSLCYALVCDSVCIGFRRGLSVSAALYNVRSTCPCSATVHMQAKVKMASMKSTHQLHRYNSTQH